MPQTVAIRSRGKASTASRGHLDRAARVHETRRARPRDLLLGRGGPVGVEPHRHAGGGDPGEGSSGSAESSPGITMTTSRALIRLPRESQTSGSARV